MKTTSLVATLTTEPSGDRELEALGEEVEYLEIRADLVGDLDPDWLRDRFPGRLVYTLRSRFEGGRFEGGKNARQRRLTAAAGRFDLVDLEGARDLIPGILTEVPDDQRLISWHGKSPNLTSLRGRFERMAEVPARFYKLIPEANQEGDSLRPLALLHSLRRDDVISFSSKNLGAWTRLVAPRLGSPLVYGSMGEVPGAPGQLSIERLRKDFGLPYLPEAEGLYGVVGRPALNSLSPRLHNGAYRALGFPGLYVPFEVSSFGDFWLDVVEVALLEDFGLPLRGLSITSPHKEAALVVAGASSPRANFIGAANTLVLTDGVWEGESTDPEGVVGALLQLGVEPGGASAAVVGCGGAGRAAALGLRQAGCDVVLANRGEERGRAAARDLRLPFVPLKELRPERFEILVQATALGSNDKDPLPFSVDRLPAETAVLEMVYGSGPTRLQRRAEARGCRVIDGRWMLLHQALEQFRLMTGQTLNRALAAELLGLEEESP